MNRGFFDPPQRHGSRRIRTRCGRCLAKRAAAPPPDTGSTAVPRASCRSVLLRIVDSADLPGLHADYVEAGLGEPGGEVEGRGCPPPIRPGGSVGQTHADSGSDPVARTRAALQPDLTLIADDADRREARRHIRRSVEHRLPFASADPIPYWSLARRRPDYACFWPT